MDQSGGPDSGLSALHAHDVLSIAIGAGLGFVALPPEWSWPVRILAGLLIAVVLLTLFSLFPAIPARILAVFGNPRVAIPVIGVLVVALAWFALSPSTAPATRQHLWQAAIPGVAVLLHELASRPTVFANSPRWLTLFSAFYLGIGVMAVSFVLLDNASLAGEYFPFPVGEFPVWASLGAVGAVAMFRTLLDLIGMIPPIRKWTEELAAIRARM